MMVFFVFEKMYYVYILHSSFHRRYYIGQTADIDARFKRHNSGLVPSTKAFLPWELILLIEKSSRSEALILEKKLKNLNTEDLQKFIEKYS